MNPKLELPEWIEEWMRFDIETMRDEKIFEALCIAWEALSENANADYRGNRSTASVRSFNALRRIEKLRK